MISFTLPTLPRATRRCHGGCCPQVEKKEKEESSSEMFRIHAAKVVKDNKRDQERHKNW
jgi:hypothetical protein